MNPQMRRKPRAPIKTASPTLRALLEHAERKGVVQAQIAEALGCHPPRISSWRRGANEPGIMIVEQLADFLGLELELKEKSDV